MRSPRGDHATAGLPAQVRRRKIVRGARGPITSATSTACKPQRTAANAIRRASGDQETLSWYAPSDVTRRRCFAFASTTRTSALSRKREELRKSEEPQPAATKTTRTTTPIAVDRFTSAGTTPEKPPTSGV